MTQEQIDIGVLKNRLEGLEERIKWLEKNWVDWTNDTKSTGQKIMIALTERLNQ